MSRASWRTKRASSASLTLLMGCSCAHELAPRAELVAHRDIARAVGGDLRCVDFGGVEVAMQVDPVVALRREAFLDGAVAVQVVVSDDRHGRVDQSVVCNGALEQGVRRALQAEGV